MTVTDEYALVNGIRLHYRDWIGAAGADAPLLLLLHGFTSHARTWDTYAPFFELILEFHLADVAELETLRERLKNEPYRKALSVVVGSGPGAWTSAVVALTDVLQTPPPAPRNRAWPAP